LYNFKVVNCSFTSAISRLFMIIEEMPKYLFFKILFVSHIKVVRFTLILSDNNRWKKSSLVTLILTQNKT